MLYLVAALLLGTMALYELVNRGASLHHAHQATVAAQPIGGKGAFALVFSKRYILLIAMLLVLLNFVNSIGEFTLRHMVRDYATQAQEANPAFNADAYIRVFSANYMFWVSVVAVLLQLVFTPRLVKRFGLAGVLFALPIVALGAYAFIALGATLAIVRWAKTAENSTDYSVMNTARQLLWLPTSREEKYKAKQATDTFFVRLGDVLQGIAIFALHTSWLALGIRGLAALNLVVVVAWLALGVAILRLNRRLSAAKAAEPAAV